MNSNLNEAVDLLIVTAGLLCAIILLIEILTPFIDDTCDKLLGLSSVSQVNDEDLYPEVDHTIIRAFLKEPTAQQLLDVQVHIDRRVRRESAEDAMLLERLQA